MTDPSEHVDVIYLNFSKALDSACHRLLVKKTVAMGIHLKINRWVEEFVKNRKFRLKLGGHLSSEDIVKSSVPQGERDLSYEKKAQRTEIAIPRKKKDKE